MTRKFLAQGQPAIDLDIWAENQRGELTAEAIRLTRMVHRLLPDVEEVLTGVDGDYTGMVRDKKHLVLKELFGSDVEFGAAVDGATFASAAGVLVVAALAASYIPARRAAAVNPVETLRGQRRMAAQRAEATATRFRR